MSGPSIFNKKEQLIEQAGLKPAPAPKKTPAPSSSYGSPSPPRSSSSSSSNSSNDTPSTASIPVPPGSNPILFNKQLQLIAQSGVNQPVNEVRPPFTNYPRNTSGITTTRTQTTTHSPEKTQALVEHGYKPYDPDYNILRGEITSQVSTSKSSYYEQRNIYFNNLREIQRNISLVSNTPSGSTFYLDDSGVEYSKEETLKQLGTSYISNLRMMPGILKANIDIKKHEKKMERFSKELTERETGGFLVDVSRDASNKITGVSFKEPDVEEVWEYKYGDSALGASRLVASGAMELGIPSLIAGAAGLVSGDSSYWENEVKRHKEKLLRLSMHEGESGTNVLSYAGRFWTSGEAIESFWIPIATLGVGYIYTGVKAGATGAVTVGKLATTGAKIGTKIKYVDKALFGVGLVGSGMVGANIGSTFAYEHAGRLPTGSGLTTIGKTLSSVTLAAGGMYTGSKMYMSSHTGQSSFVDSRFKTDKDYYTFSKREGMLVKDLPGGKNKIFASGQDPFFQWSPQGRLKGTTQLTGTSGRVGKVDVSRGLLTVRKGWSSWGTKYSNTSFSDFTAQSFPMGKPVGGKQWYFDTAKFINRATGLETNVYGTSFMELTGAEKLVTMKVPGFSMSKASGSEFVLSPKGFGKYLTDTGQMGYINKVKGLGDQGRYYLYEKSIDISKVGTTRTKLGSWLQTKYVQGKSFITGKDYILKDPYKQVLTHEQVHFLQDKYGMLKTQTNIQLEDIAYGLEKNIKGFVVEGRDFGYIDKSGIKTMFYKKIGVPFTEYKSVSYGDFYVSGKKIGSGFDYSQILYQNQNVSSGIGMPSGEGVSIGGGSVLSSQATLLSVLSTPTVSFTPFSLKAISGLTVVPVISAGMGVAGSTTQLIKPISITSPITQVVPRMETKVTPVSMSKFIQITVPVTTQIHRVDTKVTPIVASAYRMETRTMPFKTPTYTTPFITPPPPPITPIVPVPLFGGGGSWGGRGYRSPRFYSKGYRYRTWKVPTLESLLPGYKNNIKKWSM